MHSISMFVEDFGHEAFLTPLVERLAKEAEIDVDVKIYSARGGRGVVLAELGQFGKDVRSGELRMPDRLIVALDANCKGFIRKREEINSALESLSEIAL